MVLVLLLFFPTWTVTYGSLDPVLSFACKPCAETTEINQIQPFNIKISSETNKNGNEGNIFYFVVPLVYNATPLLSFSWATGLNKMFNKRMNHGTLKPSFDGYLLLPVMNNSGIHTYAY